MAARRNSSKLVPIALLLLAVAAGVAYFITRDKKTQEKLADTARREAIKAEIETTKATIKKYDQFLKLIRDAKASGTKPKYEGYDAFDYSKESEYAAAKAEQERRLSDLQARLNSAYDK
jgi:predicted deacetylase